MKKYLSLFAFLVLFGAILSLNSCKDDDPEKEMRPDCDILEFSIPSLEIVGLIDVNAKTITFSVAPDYDMTKLKDVAPTIQISPKATITPLATAKQDFTKDIKYVVKAENGTVKEWTVKMVVDLYVSKGIGKINTSWRKTASETGLSANAEATFGVLGNELIMGRSGVIVDAKTGALKTVKLNMTGIQCNGTPANDIPFTVANDDEGNFIGCTLGAWGSAAANPFKVYKWTSSQQAPVEFISHPQTATSHFGRKLVAVGDVTKTGIVTSYDCADANTKAGANHTYWTISGGTAAAGKLVSSKYNTGDIHQILTPAAATAVSPFYFSDRGASNATPMTVVKYVDAAGVEKIIKGPVPASEITGPQGDAMFKDTGWGRKVLFTKVFTFNTNKYLAVLSYYDVDVTANYYVTIMDVAKDYNVVLYDKISYTGQAFASLNMNATAGLAVSKEELGTDGKSKTMRLFSLMTSSGIACYELTNAAK